MTITKTLGEVSSGTQNVVEKIIENHNRHIVDLQKRLDVLVTEAKNATWTYIRRIKSILWDQRDRMLELKEKIESLAGKEKNRKEGKLYTIAEHIRTFRTKHEHEIDYLEIVHIPDPWRIHKVAQMRPWLGEQIEIEKIAKILEEILDELVKYLSATGDIYEKLDGYTSNDIGNGKKIDDYASEIDRFEFISRQNDYYQKMLKNAKSTLDNLQKFGKMVRLNKKYFKKGFKDDVKKVTSITYQELDQLYLGIKKEKRNVDEIRKGLENNNLVLDYSKTIHDFQTNLGGHKIDNGNNHICSLKSTMERILDGLEKGQQDMENKWNEMILGNLQTDNGSGKRISESISDNAIQYEARLFQLHSGVNFIINEFKLSTKSHLRVLKVMETVKAGLDVSKGRPGYSPCINATINRLKKWIENMIKHYKHIHEIVGIMDSSTDSLKQLKNLNEGIAWYRGMTDAIRIDLRTIQFNYKLISRIITEIKDYQKILEEMYTNIEHRTSQLIAFVYGTNSGMSILQAFAGGKNERISGSKEIIGHLAKIILMTTKLITTISQVHYSICCTKRKLECFVSSLETKVVNIKENIQNVESSIENVIICFLNCSNKHIKYTNKYIFFIQLNHIE